MSRRECPCEREILEALAASRWPERCDAQLRAHVADCHNCAELLAVALPLLNDRLIAHDNSDIPSAAIVWWKAQRRAREEAAAAATRPIVAVQWIALACTVGLLAGLLRLVIPYARAFGAAAGEGVSAVQSLSTAAMLPWIGLAAVLVLVPVTVYLATSD